MEDKFCLKSRKELDEIRKQKAEVKKQVNEISNNLVRRAGRKIDQQYYQAKGQEIEAADKLSRGTGDMGTLIKASQKADNKLARANRFWKLADKRKARKQVGESKINEISDETVYNAVAKAQDKALKSLRKDPDKRNFLRDANKLNNIYNAGLRREWRKKGLKNPVGMSAKQLGKVWDKDYEPVKDEYERQLKKRHKVDAFGNEKNESLRANDWREKLDGDEFVTLKDGREGTLGGVVYDKDNNFVGYEFSTNPYGGYEYEEIKPEDIASLAESLTAKKALAKSKTILEEYGEYQGDPNFEEIARQLEYGNTYGSTTYGAKWGEVEINGTPISDLLKTNEVIDWVSHELSYPVRDGHAYYSGLDLFFNNYSYENTIDHTDEDVIADLVALGFDETEVREMPVIKDPEYHGNISDERFKEIETWINYDINYKEPEEDEEYDESLSKADKRLVVPNRPRLKSLADDIVDLGVETAKSVGHALTGDIFRKRRKPVVSEARLKELANKGKTGMKNKNFTASEALELSEKHLEERKTRSHRRKAMVETKAKNESKIDENKKWDSFAGHSLPNGDRDDYEKTTEKELKSVVIPFSFENPDQHSPADRIYHKLIIKQEQDGTFSWSETSNDESGKGFKSAKEAFDNAVSTGEFPLEDYDGFQLDAKVDLATFFNESKISKSAQKNESAETRWGYDSYGYVEIEIPVDYIHSIAQSGDNAEAVKEALNDPFIANQFKDYSDEAIEKCFDSIGFDMTDAEVNSLTRREKEEYILWDFAWHLLDDMDESKINEVSREKANKVVKRRADQQYDAIVNYNINKPETVKALHNAEDKLDRALRLRRSSTKLRKNESMFNKYGEEVDPKEWGKKEARGLNEAKSNEVNIFLTNLGKYNEGELVGEWVKLPVDDFQPILDRIGINDEYEEWFITDYEAPFEINEYDNIEELNDIAREIQDFDSIQLEVLDAYKDNGYDMRDAIDKVIDRDYIYLEGNTEEDLAYSYIDMAGSFEDAVSKEDKQYYFDYEAYGRDLVLGGDYSYVDDAVDLNSFADKDTAIAIFGDYGEDLPSEDDIAKYKKWIEIYNNYTDEQEEELAKQGIEVFMSSIYVDKVAYDVETLEQVVDEDYEVQSGYKDYEGNIVDVSSEKELAEYVIDEVFGGVDQMSEDELERYFDYAWWGKTLAYDFDKTDNGWVQLD